MDHYLDDPQVEELNGFDFWDDEETKQIVEDYYDDLSQGLDLNSTHDF
jgi:hypothetical protein